MNNKNKELLAAKLITRPLPLYEKEFPLIFFWSPKGGCTSLIKWFFFQTELLQKAINYNPWVHTYRMEVHETQQNYKQNIIKQMLDDKKDIYKLVRNPYNRTVSSFLHTLTSKQIMNQISPGGNHNGLSFKKFLFQVKKRGVLRNIIDPHIAQQYVEGEELFIRNYVHLEHFKTEIRDIEKKYNLSESPMQNIIKSHHHRAQKMVNKGNQTFAEVNMSMETLNGPLPQYQNFYDDETRGLVRELFKKDFEMYGYNPNNLI